MRVVLTDEALRDLSAILAYTETYHPTASAALDRRLRTTLRRIGSWPESAQSVADRPGTRMVPLIRYPFRIFYRVATDRVEILHIHHTSRPTP